mmetsp:Transcript_27498/g.68868  ORF Transcript_27498/g.68868 Transcript_27498/m.68868 type:complete len:289 (-) Transcript_27498:90-956(-)
MHVFNELSERAPQHEVLLAPTLVHVRHHHSSADRRPREQVLAPPRPLLHTHHHGVVERHELSALLHDRCELLLLDRKPIEHFDELASPRRPASAAVSSNVMEDVGRSLAESLRHAGLYHGSSADGQRTPEDEATGCQIQSSGLRQLGGVRGRGVRTPRSDGIPPSRAQQVLQVFLVARREAVPEPPQIGKEGLVLVRNHPLLLVPNLLQTLLQSNSRDVKLRQKFAIASSVRQEPRGESSGSKSLADTVGPFDDVHAGSKKAIRRALVADLISLLSFRRHLCVTKSSL